MLRKEIYHNGNLTEYSQIVWRPVLSTESKGIPVPIPPFDEFKASEFRSDDFHHQNEFPHRPSVGEFLVEPLHPRIQTIQQNPGTPDYSPSDMPYMTGQVVRGRSCGQRVFHRKKTRPEKSAIAHHHGRQYRECALRAIRVKAEIPGNRNYKRHTTLLRMESLARIGTMLAVPGTMTLGALHCPVYFFYHFQWTIVYFHNSGRYNPFLLSLNKTEEEKLHYRPPYLQDP